MQCMAIIAISKVRMEDKKLNKPGLVMHPAVTGSVSSNKWWWGRGRRKREDLLTTSRDSETIKFWVTQSSQTAYTQLAKCFGVSMLSFMSKKNGNSLPRDNLNYRSSCI